MTPPTRTTVTTLDEVLAELRAHFDTTTVDVTPDGTGGVYVIVDRVSVGPGFTPSTTWLGFQVSAAYPDADIYPHYVGALTRTDGQPHGEAIQPTTWQGRPDEPALQISRRSHHRDPAVDTVVNKAVRILAWLTDH